MASTILGAIGRGYSARTILGAIGRQFPDKARMISDAYHIGYTGEQLLSRIASKKDKQNYSPDQFMTDREKAQRNYNETKKKALLQSLAAAGTLAAVGAGMYALMQRNKSPVPSDEEASKPEKEREGSPLPTVQFQTTALQQQLPQTSLQQPNQEQISPEILPRQQEPIYTKAVDLVKNIKEESRFNNLVGAGYDDETTELMLRSTLPRETISLLDKAPGGLEQLVKDYSLYMKENPQVSPYQKNLEREREQFESQSLPESAQEQVELQQVPSLSPPQAQPSAQQSPSQIQSEQQFIQQQPIETPLQATKPLASLKNGKVGEIEDVKNGVATVNVNGKTFKEKASNITTEPPEIESAVREVINSIPENLKSTALQTLVYIPENRVLLSQFYDGKWAWYLDFDEDTYKKIALGTYQPKGQGKTGIAEYQPGVADSRGAGFHNEVKINPKYSKENKGKTWGYASNEYALLHSVQPIIHKISKERVDEQGNIITSKPRKKRQP